MTEQGHERAVVQRRITVLGLVQGVGYRAWTVREARGLGLAGFVRNRRDGRVEIVAEGPADVVAALELACHQGPRMAAVASVTVDDAFEHLDGLGFCEAPTM